MPPERRGGRTFESRMEGNRAQANDDIAYVGQDEDAVMSLADAVDDAFDP